jgi:hypothetical protein
MWIIVISFNGLEYIWNCRYFHHPKQCAMGGWLLTLHFSEINDLFFFTLMITVCAFQTWHHFNENNGKHTDVRQ